MSASLPNPSEPSPDDRKEKNSENSGQPPESGSQSDADARQNESDQAFIRQTVFVSPTVGRITVTYDERNRTMRQITPPGSCSTVIYDARGGGMVVEPPATDPEKERNEPS